MTEIAHGSVILYSYVWERGEESGRKARPACVMMILRARKGVEIPLLFPVTSRRPVPERRVVEIPETEARRAGLYTPAWVIVDEFNTDDLRTSFAVEDRKPFGVFSRRFMAEIAAEAASAIRTGGARAVSRR